MRMTGENHPKIIRLTAACTAVLAASLALTGCSGNKTVVLKPTCKAPGKTPEIFGVMPSEALFGAFTIKLACIDQEGNRTPLDGLDVVDDSESKSPGNVVIIGDRGGLEIDQNNVQVIDNYEAEGVTAVTVLGPDDIDRVYINDSAPVNTDPK